MLLDDGRRLSAYPFDLDAETAYMGALNTCERDASFNPGPECNYAVRMASTGGDNAALKRVTWPTY
jgi:hypothetical protein